MAVTKSIDLFQRQSGFHRGKAAGEKRILCASGRAGAVVGVARNNICAITLAGALLVEPESNKVSPGGRPTMKVPAQVSVPHKVARPTLGLGITTLHRGCEWQR